MLYGNKHQYSLLEQAMGGRSAARTNEVMGEIRGRLATRSLSPGDRLPSVRGLAAAMGISPSTVVEAYDRLVAEGLIRPRRGSGFYVAGAAPPLDLTEAGPRLDRSVDPFWVSRQSLDAAPHVLKPGCGWLPAEWMPGGALRKAMRGLARTEEGVLADYGSTRGSASLRRLILRRLAESGIGATPEQVLLTGSGTQALDLICRFLLRPGDAVLVDDPCYFNFQALLRVHRVKLVGVPMTPTGVDTRCFAEAAAAHRPRLYLTNSALHNPTGATLSPNAAYRILSTAAAHDMVVVEDDIFADFEPDPSPRLAALDGLSRVISVGSFSKTLSASVRCGTIAARADWIEGLIDLQVATNFGGPSPVAAELIAAMLGDGGYRKHMEEVRRRLAQARRVVATQLSGLGIEPWLMPRGGFYLWCRLPGGRDSAAAARAALAEDVVLAPGNVFSPSQRAGDHMRFNVAQSADPRLFGVLARALAVSAPASHHPPE